MHLILDAYNILKPQLGVQEIGDASRERFISRLIAYAARKGHTILVVFDGGSSLRAERTPYERVIVVYAGAGVSADDYIKRMVSERAYHHPVVVTSDRALARYVRIDGARVVPADIFYERFNDALSDGVVRSAVDAKKSGAIKRKGVMSSPDLDALMAEKPVVIKDIESGLLGNSAPYCAKNVSKEIRKIVQKL